MLTKFIPLYYFAVAVFSSNELCSVFCFILEEHRGVGGIFFDDLDEPDLEQCFDFVCSCCDAILPSYIPIVEKNMGKKYTEKEKQWLEIRRGRSVARML